MAEMRCQQLAARQHGVFSRQQALTSGMSSGAIRHRVRTGRWLIHHPRIYVGAGTPITCHTKLMSASLWAGEQSTISHRSAAFLWQLDGISGKVVELSTVKHIRSQPEMIVHRVAALPRWEIATLNSIRCTRPSRTLIDLASIVDERSLELAMEDCLRRRLTAVPVLRQTLIDIGTRGRTGTRMLARLLEKRVDRTDSALEVDLARLIRDSGLPPPVAQYRISQDGRVVARPDFAYPSAKVAVEAHSFRWHSSRERWVADVRRIERLNGLGWIVLHVTHDDIHHRRQETIERIKDQLIPRLRGIA